MENIIEIKNLSKFFGEKQILKNITFSVPKGTFTIFAGKNGSGKTTTIKCMLDLYYPHTNSIVNVNHLPSTNPDSRAKIGYVPEKDDFSNEIAINFLIRMGLLNNIPMNKLNEKIDELANLFEAANYLKSPLNKLSSGNAKKIMIIQALLSNAECLIMDEPTDNLDPETRKIFYDLMKKLQKQNKTIFISSHNLLEVGEYADYAIIIANGEIKYSGKLQNRNQLLKLYGL